LAQGSSVKQKAPTARIPIGLLAIARAVQSPVNATNLSIDGRKGPEQARTPHPHEDTYSMGISHRCHLATFEHSSAYRRQRSEKLVDVAAC